MSKVGAADQTPRMSMAEKGIIRQMHFDQGMSRTRIACLVKRSLCTVSRLLAQKRAPRTIGRPRILTGAKIDRLCTLLDKMVDDAGGNHEVTLAMLMRRARLKASERTVSDAIHSRGYRFRNMRSKPILTPDDVKERFAWAKKHRTKSGMWWLQNVHIHLDNHVFKRAATAQGRGLLAKRTVRGVYRKKSRSLRPSVVKPNTKLKAGLPKGILKAGGIGGGKVLVWDTVIGKWCGDTAAALYTDVVLPALKTRYGAKCRFCILEDNDPTGNRSNVGMRAKVAAKLDVFCLPKRSPDLNVMDYSVWAEVERRLRVQEKRWPEDKRETRAEFERRLDRVAKALPISFIDKSIMDMKRRCLRLYAAEGGLFEEGGKGK